MTYDLLVIGAGPAGCAAAACAALGGLRVALVERRRIPRHKTCGGGVPATVQRYFDGLDLAGLADVPIRKMRHTWRYTTGFAADLGSDEEPVRLYCVRRDKLDAGLAAHAARCGADVLDGVTVRDVDVGDAAVDVRGNLGGDGALWKASAEFVIGADGATGSVGKSAGLSPRRTAAIAMEYELPYDWSRYAGGAEPDAIHLVYGTVRNGYVWAFPKADHFNIGAGLFRGSHEPSGTHLSAELETAALEMARALGIQTAPDRSCLHYHPVPVWAGRCRLQHRTGRVLLAGDAASLVNPLFGDGILNAVRSGVLAAQAVINGRTLSYTEDIYAEIGRDLDAAERVARLFYSVPEVCFRLGVMRPSASRTAARLLCGELRYRDVSSLALRRLGSAVRRSVMGRGEAKESNLP